MRVRHGVDQGFRPDWRARRVTSARCWPQRCWSFQFPGVLRPSRAIPSIPRRASCRRRSFRSTTTIELAPDLDEPRASGAVEKVDIEVREPTARLTLNALELDDRFRITRRRRERAEIALDAAAETATLTFPQPLAVGRASPAHRLHGADQQVRPRLLRASITPTDDGHEADDVAASSSPPMRAAIFPCWDEPAFKASFALTATGAAEHFLAVSNMPVVERGSRSATDSKQRHASRATPKMSSYLFVLTVRRARAHHRARSDGVDDRRRHHARARAAQGQYALDSAVDLLRLLQGLFRRRNIRCPSSI